MDQDKAVRIRIALISMMDILDQVYYRHDQINKDTSHYIWWDRLDKLFHSIDYSELKEWVERMK